MNVYEKTQDEKDFMFDLFAKLIKVFEEKNMDYGDSMGVQCLDFGSILPIVVRMNDKMNRVKALIKNGHNQVKDESIEDTLGDLITYSAMAIYELRRLSHE